MPDFIAALNPPKDEAAILQQFWANAPPLISRLAIDTLSLINQTIMTMIRGDALLWQSIADIGRNLTSIYNAKGPWLDVIAEGFYGIQRTKQTQASGSVLVGAGTTGTPPNPGTAITFTNANTGITYKGVYSGGTTSTVYLIASQTGPAGNCPIFDLIPASPSSYAISSSDPSLLNISSSDPTINHATTQWIMHLGSNGEADDSLRQRCVDVISMRSTGGAAPIAAQLRAGTMGQCARVYVPKGYIDQRVYVAGASGPLSPLWQTIVADIVSRYSPSSSSASVVGCDVAISQIAIKIDGQLYFRPGAPQSAISAVFSGLTDWLQSIPIVGSEGYNMRLVDIERAIINLDDTDQCVPAIRATLGTRAPVTASTDIVIPSAIGYDPFILSADLSGLVVSYR